MQMCLCLCSRSMLPLSTTVISLSYMNKNIEVSANGCALRLLTSNFVVTPRDWRNTWRAVNEYWNRCILPILLLHVVNVVLQSERVIYEKLDHVMTTIDCAWMYTSSWYMNDNIIVHHIRVRFPRHRSELDAVVFWMYLWNSLVVLTQPVLRSPHSTSKIETFSNDIWYTYTNPFYQILSHTLASIILPHEMNTYNH